MEIAGCRLNATGYRLQVTGSLSEVHYLQATGQRLKVTGCAIQRGDRSL